MFVLTNDARVIMYAEKRKIAGVFNMNENEPFLSLRSTAVQNTSTIIIDRETGFINAISFIARDNLLVNDATVNGTLTVSELEVDQMNLTYIQTVGLNATNAEITLLETESLNATNCVLINLTAYTTNLSNTIITNGSFENVTLTNVTFESGSINATYANITNIGSYFASITNLNVSLLESANLITANATIESALIYNLSFVNGTIDDITLS